MQFAPVRAWSCGDGLGGRRRSSRGELYCSAWWRSIRSALRRQRTRRFASSRFFLFAALLHFCLSESFFLFLFCKTRNALNNGIGFIKTFVVVNGSSVAVCKCLPLMVRSRFLFLLCICLPSLDSVFVIFWTYLEFAISKPRHKADWFLCDKKEISRHLRFILTPKSIFLFCCFAL